MVIVAILLEKYNKNDILSICYNQQVSLAEDIPSSIANDTHLFTYRKATAMTQTRVSAIAAALVFWLTVVSFVEFNFPSLLPVTREEMLNFLAGTAVVVMPILGAIITHVWIARLERNTNPETISVFWLLFLELRWLFYAGAISLIVDLFILSNYGYSSIEKGMSLPAGIMALGANFGAALFAYVIIQAIYGKDSEGK
jgi:hypothetical protein